MNNIKQQIIKNQIMELVGKENEFIFKVMEESERTRKIYPAFHSYHEAFGVIYEEFMEFFDYVKSSPAKMNLTKEEFDLKIKEELVQISAMCLCCVNELCEKGKKDE